MLKVVLAIIIISTALAQVCPDILKTEAPDELANTMCLFSTPTVVGASVSAGFGTSTGGPASILSRMLNPAAKIDNQALSGATSVQILRRFETQQKDPSIILGFDLFFWDAARNECGEPFVESTKKFFKAHKDKKTPMVIGRIPVGAPFPVGVRMAGTRPCARVINSLVNQFCKVENNCIVYDPKDCIDAMKEPVSPEGLNYFRDPLHTSTEGNKFCAREFIQSAQFKDLTCQIK